MTAAPRFTVPRDEVGARMVVVACRDCDWIEARAPVPPVARTRLRHRCPGMVWAWLYCDHGCWMRESTDYLTCTAGTVADPHAVLVDPERSVFL